MRVEESLSGSVAVSDSQKIMPTKKVHSSKKVQLKNELTLAKLALESAKMAAAALEERLAKEGEAGDGEQKNDDDNEDSVDDVLLLSEDEIEAGTTAPASHLQPGEPTPLLPHVEAAPSTPLRSPHPVSSDSPSPTCVTETTRIESAVEFAVGAALRNQAISFQQQLVAAQTEQRQAEALRDAEQSTRMHQLEQLVLDLRTTNIADDIVSPEKAESEAQKLLLLKRRVAQTSSTIVGAMFSPPVAPPVFSESAGSLLAELKIFLSTMGMAMLMLSAAKRMQSFVDKASMILPIEDIDVPVAQLTALGARMTHGGKLFEPETSSVFVQSVLEAERCCSQRTEAFVQASSSPTSTMYTMLKRSKLIQQGQPGIGPLCALV
jgi:hypothetical protein